MSTLTYARRWDHDATGNLAPLPAETVAVGDAVIQDAWGKGLGRLEDTGRRGTVVAIARTRVTVDFGGMYGVRPVSPAVLRLEGSR